MHYDADGENTHEDPPDRLRTARPASPAPPAVASQGTDADDDLTLADLARSLNDDDRTLAGLRQRLLHVRELLTLASATARAAQALYYEARAEFEEVRVLHATYEAEHPR